MRLVCLLTFPSLATPCASIGLISCVCPTVVADSRDEQGPMAIRLTFAYDATGIRLIGRASVDKRAPPSADGTAPLPAAALLAELRSYDNETTYRQIIRDALPLDVEVFDPDAERGVYRSPKPLPSGAFSIVVPDDSGAKDLVLVAGPVTATHPSLVSLVRAAQDALAPEMRKQPRLVVVGRFPLR
jgi:hypothetical protein